MLSDSEFLNQSKKTISVIFDFVEENFADFCEADFDGEILTITLNDDRIYLINAHKPTKQIWLSSPLSGAHHFSLNDNFWLCSRTKKNLSELLSQEFSQISNKTIIIQS